MGGGFSEKDKMTGSKGLFIQDYFRTLTQVWFSPGRFFSDLPESSGLTRPLAFLVLSSLLFAAGNLLYLRERILLKVAILFINAVAMPFIASAFGYLSQAFLGLCLCLRGDAASCLASLFTLVRGDLEVVPRGRGHGERMRFPAPPGRRRDCPQHGHPDPLFLVPRTGDPLVQRAGMKSATANLTAS